jgi:hypothetical protein
VTDAGIEPFKQMPQLKTLVANLTQITYAGRLFVDWERLRLFDPYTRGPRRDPKQSISVVWSTGRLGLVPNEDKIVSTPTRGPLPQLPRVGPPMLNTTRFAILFADIVTPGGASSASHVALYNKSKSSVSKYSGPGSYEYVYTTLFDHLDIIVTAPGQMYKLQVFDEGNTLVINGRHKFDLRAKKKYIVVRRDGSAREL